MTRNASKVFSTAATVLFTYPHFISTYCNVATQTTHLTVKRTDRQNGNDMTLQRIRGPKICVLPLVINDLFRLGPLDR